MAIILNAADVHFSTVKACNHPNSIAANNGITVNPKKHILFFIKKQICNSEQSKISGSYGIHQKIRD